MADKKTLAIVLGAAAGVTVATMAIAWYVRSHAAPDLKTVQDKLEWAHAKLDELEGQVANALKNPLSAT